MLDMARHDQAVARSQFYSLPVCVKHDAPVHNIEKLMMWMLVPGPFPALRKISLYNGKVFCYK